MRIVGGKYRGRKLQFPDLPHTRPTKDHVREAIFNVLLDGLGINLLGKRVLDVFAGSGALGLEAYSRGASPISFIEKDLQTLKVLNHNIAALSAQPDTSVIKQKAELYFHQKSHEEPFDLIFLDPPYDHDGVTSLLSTLLQNGWCRPNTCFVLEQDRRKKDQIEEMKVLREKTYGRTQVLFMEPLSDKA